MTEQDRRNIANARLLYSGEASEFSIIAPNIVWHVPGHNPASGVYNGYQEYAEVMPSRMAPLTRWEFDVHDVMANGDYVMVTVSVRGERNGKTVDLRGGHLLRMNAQGQVAEGWGFSDDQDALDEFFA